MGIRNRRRGVYVPQRPMVTVDAQAQLAELDRVRREMGQAEWQAVENARAQRMSVDPIQQLMTRIAAGEARLAAVEAVLRAMRGA